MAYSLSVVHAAYGFLFLELFNAVFLSDRTSHNKYNFRKLTLKSLIYS